MERTAKSKEHFIKAWSDEMRGVIGFYPNNEDVERFMEIRDEVIAMIERKAETLKFD